MTRTAGNPAPNSDQLSPASAVRYTPREVAAYTVLPDESRGSVTRWKTGTSGRPPSARCHVWPPSLERTTRTEPAIGLSEATYNPVPFGIHTGDELKPWYPETSDGR